MSPVLRSINRTALHLCPATLTLTLVGIKHRYGAISARKGGVARKKVRLKAVLLIALLMLGEAQVL